MARKKELGRAAAHDVEAAGDTGAAVVVKTAGPVMKLAAWDRNFVVEADDIEGFAGRAGDQQLFGKTVVHAQQSSVVSGSRGSDLCSHGRSATICVTGKAG